MNYKFLSKNIYKVILFLGVVLAIVLNLHSINMILGKFLKVMSPVFIGCLIAFILNILVELWEKVYFPNTKNKKIISSRRGVCIVLSFLSIVLVFVFISGLVIPQISESFSVFSKSFPTMYDKSKLYILEYADEVPTIEEFIKSQNLDGKELVQKFLSIISSWTGGFISFLGSFFGVIMNIVVGGIIAIYIVATKETLSRQFDKLFKRFFKEEFTEKIYLVFDVANETFHAFIVGQFIEAVILGTLCAIGLWIFRFPYAPMIGSVIGLTALIPIIGAYIGGLFGFLMILTVNPVKAIFFIVFLVVLQQIEGNLIYPKVVGDSVGLPGLWVMISILVGGGLYGISGVFFGLPITATIYKILRIIVNNKKIEICE